MAADNKKSFLDLPTELRSRCYRFVFGNPQIAIRLYHFTRLSDAINRGQKQQEPPFFKPKYILRKAQDRVEMSITLVCRQIREESLEEYLTTLTLLCHEAFNSIYPTDFCVKPKFLNAIRYLRMVYHLNCWNVDFSALPNLRVMTFEQSEEVFEHGLVVQFNMDTVKGWLDDEDLSGYLQALKDSIISSRFAINEHSLETDRVLTDPERKFRCEWAGSIRLRFYHERTIVSTAMQRVQFDYDTCTFADNVVLGGQYGDDQAGRTYKMLEKVVAAHKSNVRDKEQL